MIEVEIIEDVRKVKSKAVGPFTLRQIICIILAASYSIPLGLAIPGGIAIKFIVGFMVAIPVVICGWITLNKEPFEIVLIRYIYKHFLTPRKRKYKTDNAYKKALTKTRKQAEEKRVKAMSVKQRKEYEKKKKNGITVTYSQKAEYKMYR